MLAANCEWVRHVRYAPAGARRGANRRTECNATKEGSHFPMLVLTYAAPVAVRMMFLARVHLIAGVVLLTRAPLAQAGVDNLR